jgi:hypothetical protein
LVPAGAFASAPEIVTDLPKVTFEALAAIDKFGFGVPLGGFTGLAANAGETQTSDTAAIALNLVVRENRFIWDLVRLLRNKTTP